MFNCFCQYSFSSCTDDVTFPLDSPGAGPAGGKLPQGPGWSGAALTLSSLSVIGGSIGRRPGDQDIGGQHHVQGAGHHEGELLRPGPGAGRHAQEVQPGEIWFYHMMSSESVSFVLLWHSQWSCQLHFLFNLEMAWESGIWNYSFISCIREKYYAGG